MKWYSEDRRQMINLDSVDGYVFIPAKEFLENNPDANDIEDFKLHGDRIEIILCGTPYLFRGEVALEIFNLLTANLAAGVEQQKQLLNG